MRCGFGLRAGRVGRGCGFPGGREVCVSEKEDSFCSWFVIMRDVERILVTYHAEVFCSVEH